MKVKADCYIGAFTTIVITNDKDENAYKESFLSIGKNTYIGENNNIRATGGKIVIGNNCSISQNVTLVSSNHNTSRDELICAQGWSLNKNFIIIEDDVWIAANCVVLPGVTIHKGAVIGAGSVVTKDIPEFAIAVGNPARVFKYRE